MYKEKNNLNPESKPGPGLIGTSISLSLFRPILCRFYKTYRYICKFLIDKGLFVVFIILIGISISLLLIKVFILLFFKILISPSVTLPLI